MITGKEIRPQNTKPTGDPMYKEIPLKQIKPSKNNYRKAYAVSALKELTASVKAKGVLEPILVRPLSGKQKGNYEIVAGHRRHQASVDAGLKMMPAIVSELSDEEALEIQVIENSHREDPNPIDEAHGFKRLIEMGKHTPETLAAKIGHSMAYVLGRVKLAGLDKKVQDAITAGQISLGHALLFTRLKNSGDQKRLLKDIVNEGLSVAGAARQMRDYSTALSDALFDTAKCETCDYRSRNQAVLFPDIKADECTDRSCFDTKVKAYYIELLNKKKAEGFTIFTDVKTVEKHTGNNAKTSARICANKSDEREYDVSGPFCPQAYKTLCVGCHAYHAYYLVDKNNNRGGKELEFGEICLDKKCLDKMRKVKAEPDKKGASSGRSSQQDAAMEKMRRAERAGACRDRFLHKELPPMVAASEEAQKRLALHLILGQFGEYDKVMGAYLDLCGVPVKEDEEAPGPFSPALPFELLDGAISAALVARIGVIHATDMLLLAPVAGLDVRAEFRIDREYLESQSFKNKGDLLKLAEELGVDELIEAKKPKAGIIEQLLGLELKGKVPKEIAEACKVDEELEDGGEDDEDDND